MVAFFFVVVVVVGSFAYIHTHTHTGTFVPRSTHPSRRSPPFLYFACLHLRPRLPASLAPLHVRPFLSFYVGMGLI